MKTTEQKQNEAIDRIVNAARVVALNDPRHNGKASIEKFSDGVIDILAAAREYLETLQKEEP